MRFLHTQSGKARRPFHRAKPNGKGGKAKPRILRAQPGPNARRPADDGLIQIEVRHQPDLRLSPGIIWSIGREPIYADDGATITGTRFTPRKLTWDLPLEQDP